MITKHNFLLVTAVGGGWPRALQAIPYRKWWLSGGKGRGKCFPRGGDLL